MDYPSSQQSWYFTSTATKTVNDVINYSYTFSVEVIIIMDYIVK